MGFIEEISQNMKIQFINYWPALELKFTYMLFKSMMIQKHFHPHYVQYVHWTILNSGKLKLVFLITVNKKQPSCDLVQVGEQRIIC